MQINVFLVLLFLAVFVKTGEASLQQLVFYQGQDCIGRSEIVYKPRPDLFNSSVGTATSVRIIGLWTITIQKQISQNHLSGWTVFRREGTQPPNGFCGNKADLISAPDWQNYRFSLINKYGPNDMTTSQVTFFTEDSFNGLQYHAKADTPKLTPRPFTMMSYSMFGNQAWLAYPEHDFGGEPKCLKPDSENEDQFNYDVDTSFVVGSVKAVETCNGSATNAILGLYSLISVVGMLKFIPS